MSKLPLIAALALFAALPAFAQAPGRTVNAAPAAAAAARTGEGQGVVKAVDIDAGTITLHHGPVAALGWPAMTMTFKAAPALLQGVKPGQKVTFTVADGETPEVVALAPQ
jgi:Cu(I)/Ag(I) efflux system protein CusF